MRPKKIDLAFLVIEDVRSRFLTRVSKNGPLHPTEPSLGCCHLWTGTKTRQGYGLFFLSSRGGTDVRILAHRYSYFCIARKPGALGALVLHKCDNPTCVNPDHLLIGNNRQNTQHMVARGRAMKKDDPRILRGESSPVAKLTDDDVRAIRSDNRSRVEIAAQYGVTPGQISHIRTGRSWRHIL